MNPLLSKYSASIIQMIHHALDERKNEYATVSSWGEDTIDKLAEFSTQGKVLRGNLVMITAEMLGKTIDDNVLKTAAAIEMIHSSLLIHDDIMDQDTKRRGIPTIHTQYEDHIDIKKKTNSKHLATSLAICAGDVGYFFAIELLGTLTVKNSSKLLTKISREIALVGIAQMQDIASFTNTPFTENDVLKMYRYKTGRYSISLPLSLGAILADAPEELIKDLEKLGESMGIMYQIIDDRIGLYGDLQTTGKNTGTDIKEDKNTLYKTLLLEKAIPEDQITLAQYFGNRHITDTEIHYIHSLVEKYGINTQIDQLCSRYKKYSLDCIEKLEISSSFKSILKEFVSFIEHRQK